MKNTGNEPLEPRLADVIRADGEFTFGQQPESGLFWAYDAFWRQAYGTLLEDRGWKFETGELKKGDRPELRIQKADGKPLTLPPGESIEIVRYLFPAADSADVIALARELRGQSLDKVELRVRDADGAGGRCRRASGKPRPAKPWARGGPTRKGLLSTRVARRQLPGRGHRLGTRQEIAAGRHLARRASSNSNCPRRAMSWPRSPTTTASRFPARCSSSARTDTARPEFRARQRDSRRAQRLLHRRRQVPRAARPGQVRRDRQPRSGVRRGVHHARRRARQGDAAGGQAQADGRYQGLAQRRFPQPLDPLGRQHVQPARPGAQPAGRAHRVRPLHRAQPHHGLRRRTSSISTPRSGC